MLLLTIDDSLSSGLWPELAGGIQQIGLADKAFASGAYGEVYKGLTLNGKPFAKPLAVKLLFEDGAGVALAGYSTIRKLQGQIAQHELDSAAQGRTSLRDLPLLRALPQLSFAGHRDDTGEPVRGYIAELLPLPPFGEFNDLFDHDDPNERQRRYQAFYGLDQTQRLRLGVDLIRGFQALTQLNFIHADLNAHNLLVSVQPPALCLLDFDSGAVTAGTKDEPQTFGKPGEWLAPEVLTQLMQPGTTRVKVNLDTDTWSVAIGLHYLLFPLHPLFFLRTLGLNDMRAYLNQFTWPDIDTSSPLFNPQAAGHYAWYRKQLTTLPAGLLKLFSATINSGTFNINQRPSYNRWLQEFNRMLAVEAVITRFDSSPQVVSEPSPVRIFWQTDGAVSLTLSGVGDVTNLTETTITVSDDATFTLEATSFGGQKVRQDLTIKTDKRPPEISGFRPEPSTVLVGDPVQLCWQTARAVKLTVTPGNNPAKQLAAATTLFTHKPTETTRYVLRAESAFGQSTKASAEVQVFPRPVITDFAPGHQKIKPGQATTLRWKAKHFQQLTLHVGSKAHDVTGRSSFDVKPTGSADYQLEALALDGRTTISAATAIEVVQPVKIKKFSADRTVILPTVAVRFSWQVIQGQQLTLEPDGLDVTGESSCEVHPGRSTTYRLVARNDLYSVTSDAVHIEVQPLPRLDAFKMPPAPRLTLTPPPTLGHWMPHDPTQARRQLFAEQVLPPAPAGSSQLPVGNLYARLRTALAAKVERLLSGQPGSES
ncbi:protein kinase domain-containing protein [Hymenobacter latericus]|uniref:protein kinase domain-containing protein n=1 Tax=Hymenobacter sp. YIM 151858-1 TaxID=2987688 RepID=UPI002226C849|nr:hypothetical protein [Hymenobacter sp. YIM 151858-1]UYZ58058.1 hypothetical protein OIS50_13435 [Hymenobacter sp. YIM 151858-1]